MPGFSREARQSAALARKIKSRFGQSAYEAYKRSGTIPSGLDDVAPRSSSSISREAKKAASAVAPSPDTIAKITSARKILSKSSPSIDPTEAKLAEALPDLSTPEIMAALAKQQNKSDRSRYVTIAKAQAKNKLPDKLFVDHYTQTKIFSRRGDSPEFVKKVRDTLQSGGRVPLYATPVGTRVAIYHSDDAPSPDVVGTITAHFDRVPEGLSKPVPYIRFNDDDGNIYEYPALLGGGSKSPHAQFASFAAVDPILRGQSFVPTVGWNFPNFYTGEDAGPSGAPDDIAQLAKAMQRAVSWQRAVAARKATQGSQLNDPAQITAEIGKQRVRLSKSKPGSSAAQSAQNRIAALEKRLGDLS